MKRNCDNCNEPIPSARLKLIPNAKLCVSCKSENDEFKWKMKTINRDDEPTIAKDQKTWDKIKKQKQLRDI